MTKQEFKGQIIHVDIEEVSGIYIGEEPGRIPNNAFAAQFPSHTHVSVRYAISPTGIWPETLDEVAADELSLLEGKAYSDYGAQYSDLTGYLWTDEDAKVGGHDLIAILNQHVGEYLWMEVEINET